MRETVQQTLNRMSGHYVATGGFLGRDVAKVMGSSSDGVIGKPPATEKKTGGPSNQAWATFSDVTR
jgi:hypothetical protein